MNVTDRRRAFVACLAVAAAACRVGAQPARRARVAFVLEPPLDDAMRQTIVGAFLQGLRDLGYVEGQQFDFEVRSADGKRDRLSDVVGEVLTLRPDVLVAAFPAAALAAKRATTTVPIVAVSVDSPVDSGLAATLARPGGNVTGISSWGTELVAKRLQLLRELVPSTRVAGILAGADSAMRSRLATGRVQWGSALGIEVRVYEARDLPSSEAAFAAMARDGIHGLVVVADTNTYTNRVRLNELCLRRRLPSVWGGRDFLTGGALASYQSDFPALFKRAATLVEAILKGGNPGEIPFEQATKLELVIDRRAAKALGVAVPKALLVAADAVLE